MKILFVCSGNRKDGISPIVKNQWQSLVDQGISIDFFLIKGKGLISYVIHIFILRNYLRKHNYSIIHAHYGLCGIVAHLSRRREKVIVSFMGSDLNGSVYQNGNLTILGYIESLLNKFFAKYYFDYNIVKSQKLKDTLFNKTESHIIPNGVDFLKFYPIDKVEARNELKIPLDLKIVLFAADPKRTEKNYHLAEEAIKLISNSKIVLKVVFNIDQKTLNKYYNASDVILLTSFNEGSPNVIKEALACNCVIVATDVGDVKQNIQNINGCFICSFNPIDVSRKISLALETNNSDGRVKISEFENRVIAKKIINIYILLSK